MASEAPKASSAARRFAPALAALFLSCAPEAPARGGGFAWSLPANFPAPPVPADNPMSAAKTELGRALFYDTRLSANGKTSCGTCHKQALAFTDGRAQAVGTTGEVHPRGAMSLANVAYASRFAWANPLLDRLEDQALLPMVGDDPVEMGLAGRAEEALATLRSDRQRSPFTTPGSITSMARRGA